jgi:hypothetical protein
MSNYVPDRSPHFHWQWASGAGYGAGNTLGLEGNLLSVGLLRARFSAAEAACTAAGCNTHIFNLPAGFISGENSSVATWDLLAIEYPHITNWLRDEFPNVKRPGRKYGLYMGGRQKEPYDLEEYNDGSTESIPPGSFFVDAVAEFRRLGFDHVYTDATEGSPSVRPDGPDANNALMAAGWRVCAEFVPHTGIIYAGNTLDVDDSLLGERRHMIVWRVWRDLFRSRFTRDLPGGVEVHVCPQFGDSDFTTGVVDELLGKGFIISPYWGFETTAPTVSAYIAQRQQAFSNNSNSRTRERARNR